MNYSIKQRENRQDFLRDRPWNGLFRSSIWSWRRGGSAVPPGSSATGCGGFCGGRAAPFRREARWRRSGRWRRATESVGEPSTRRMNSSLPKGCCGGGRTAAVISSVPPGRRDSPVSASSCRAGSRSTTRRRACPGRCRRAITTDSPGRRGGADSPRCRSFRRDRRPPVKSSGDGSTPFCRDWPEFSTSAIADMRPIRCWN